MTKSKKKAKNPLTIVYASALAIVVFITIGVALYSYVSSGYKGDPKWVYIPEGSDAASVRDTLSTIDADFGEKVYRLWNLFNGKPSVAHGAYKIESGTSALAAARKIASGRQTPVKVVFNNIRTMGQLAEKISDRMEFTPAEFIDACDTVLTDAGFKKAEFPAAFLPDSYEFYWTASPVKVVSTLLEYRNRFWTEERRHKASAVGLTPVGVATVGSIVEEETANIAERPTIARLYLNRLNRSMPLQADPTVKFAVGDFTLKRIRDRHIATESPYNTYKVKGLPPGPIRIVDKTTLDQVLDAPEHNYLYMCAKEDLSGRHNFASDFETHKKNANLYRAELDRRGIK